jgi:threonine synthase
MNGRDGGMTAEQLGRFRATGALSIESDQRARFIDGSFRAAAFDDDATLTEIRRIHDAAGMLLDPHTATATAAVRTVFGPAGPRHPVVTTATAHPAKFPDAVRAASGVTPELPPHLADLFERSERSVDVANDLRAVESLVTTLVGR